MTEKKIKSAKNSTSSTSSTNNKYMTKIVKDGNYRNLKKTFHRIFAVKNTNDKSMNLKDVKFFYDKLKQSENISNVQIIANTPFNKYWTIINEKIYNKNFTEEEFDDYFKNKVENPKHFEQFNTLTFSIIYKK
jgi:lipoprotein NlpI